jgi:alpha-glucoside transport system permease protein
MNWTRAMIGVVGLGVVITALVIGFQLLALYPPEKILQVPIGVIGGVGGAVLLFFFLNMLVESLPGRISRGLLPYAFLLPAFGLIGLMLVYPSVQTIIYSFADDTSEAWVGLDNYRDVFGDPDFRTTLVNNLLWLAIVPALTVGIGLAVAQVADKLSPTLEKVAKSIIFLPMAISFVGAATIWRFVYAYAPEGRPQVGLLNAIITSLGFDPVTWLETSAFSVNDMLLMVILIWLQTGFAMVLLSAAIKSVPEDTLEAARLDGASEWKIFWQVVVPQIRGTLITVFITVLILVLKVFDIVYVMTGGRYETSVIGVDFFQEIFTFLNNGRASAIVVVLLAAIIPVLIYQVRHFRAEERER